MNKKIIFFTILIPTFLDAIIQKITTWDDIKKYAAHENAAHDATLVIVDIHDTLIKAFYPGCAAQLRDLEAQGHNVMLEERFITYRWNTVKPAEDILLDLLIWLQQRFNVIALTKSKPSEESYILGQLASMGIDFSKDFGDWPRTCLQTNNAQCTALFNKGVIFSKLYDKCTALQLFLTKFKFVQPRKIMLIDDKFENHQAFEQCAHRHGFDYIGLWYQPDWLRTYYKSSSCP